jgi:2-phospho-L-lactate guanylyltransferase
MEAMAILPVKPFAEAKQRLAQVLDDAARIELSRRLLRRTITVLKRARGVSRLVVVSRDDQVLRMARRRGAWGMVETKSGLNQALEQATRVAIANGARAILVVPVDLPELQTRDVEKIIALGAKPPCIVIAPAQRDRGTNALLVNPAGAIHYAFGENSFPEHQHRAFEAGVAVRVYDAKSVAFDLDLPEDLAKIPNSQFEI